MTDYYDRMIACTQTVWDAIAPAEGTKEIWHYPYSQAKTGYWNTHTGKPIYNLIAKAPEFDALMAALEAHTPGAAVYVGKWEQGSGLDELTDWHDPAEVLAIQKGIQLYDQDGNPAGTQAPTYAVPNFAHSFAGQKERIFAGDFSDDFNEDFR